MQVRVNVIHTIHGTSRIDTQVTYTDRGRHGLVIHAETGSDGNDMSDYLIDAGLMKRDCMAYETQSPCLPHPFPARQAYAISTLADTDCSFIADGPNQRVSTFKPE